MEVIKVPDSAFVILLYFVLAVLSACGGSVTTIGRCPDVAPLTKFDVNRFLGEWYEISRYPEWYEVRSGCARKTLSSVPSGLRFHHHFVRDRIGYDIVSNATVDSRGRAIIHLEEKDNSNMTITNSSVWILATDYISYALAYECVDSSLLNMRQISSWVLSRTTALNELAQNLIQNVIRDVPGLYLQSYEAVEFSSKACETVWNATLN